MDLEWGGAHSQGAGVGVGSGGGGMEAIGWRGEGGGLQPVCEMR